MNSIQLNEKRREIGLRLKHQRVLLELTQEECSMPGLTRQTIIKIEKGGNVDFNTILLYSNKIKLEIDFKKLLLNPPL